MYQWYIECNKSNLTYFYGRCLSFLLHPSPTPHFFFRQSYTRRMDQCTSNIHQLTPFVKLFSSVTNLLQVSYAVQSFRLFFYRCTEMFPDKPNLRSRKAFFVVKKRLIWSALAQIFSPKKNIGFRVSKNRTRKRFF